MFNTLYIFVAIHILRGCPKTIPLPDHKSSKANARTLNAASICVSQKPQHSLSNLYRNNNVSSLGKIPSNTQHTDTMYTALVSAAVSAARQAKPSGTAQRYTTVVARLISKQWPAVLIALSISFAVIASTDVFLVFLINEYLKMYPIFTNEKKPVSADD
ncbi:hypothetical protein SprV_0200642700 [Sparganum proliferum]